MQYQVPQFIEVEDKIFGPLTFKQFAYLVGGGGISFLVHRFIGFPFSILIALPTLAFALAMAFYRVNNKPFIEIFEAAVKYTLGSKLYVWKKQEKRVAPEAAVQMPGSSVYVPKLSESKLRELTWNLDINETIYSNEERRERDEKTGREGPLNAFKGLSYDLNENMR